MVFQHDPLRLVAIHGQPAGRHALICVKFNRDSGGDSDHRNFVYIDIELQISVETGRICEINASWDIWKG